MSYEKKIIQFQRLVEELARKMPKITSKKFKNETIYLDFTHYERCIFEDCEIFLEYGISSLIDCEFHRCSFNSKKGSPISFGVSLDRLLKESRKLDNWR